MTFNDFFKSGIAEKVTAFSAIDTVIALSLAFVVGLFIFLIYKKTFNGVMYSSGFGVSLLAMTLITTLIILAISSNVVLSLGMVGALSIVRFRAAVKDPMDIAYLFWAIAAGIVIGAGMIPLALFGSIFIGVVLMVFVNKRPDEKAYILVAHCSGDASEKDVLALVKSSVRKFVVKAKTVSPKGIELTLEVRLKEMSTEFINQVAVLDGVSDAMLVSYNGEYMS